MFYFIIWRHAILDTDVLLYYARSQKLDTMEKEKKLICNLFIPFSICLIRFQIKHETNQYLQNENISLSILMELTALIYNIVDYFM